MDNCVHDGNTSSMIMLLTDLLLEHIVQHVKNYYLHFTRNALIRITPTRKIKCGFH